MRKLSILAAAVSVALFMTSTNTTSEAPAQVQQQVVQSGKEPTPCLKSLLTAVLYAAQLPNLHGH